MNAEFKLKGKYTLVTMGRMSIATRMEIIVSTIDPATGKIWYKLPKGRSEYPMDQDLAKTLIFDGHGLPFTLASEQGCFRSTGRFEFRGDNPEALKAFISEKCLNSDPLKLEKIYITTGIDDPIVYLFPLEQQS